MCCTSHFLHQLDTQDKNNFINTRHSLCRHYEWSYRYILLQSANAMLQSTFCKHMNQARWCHVCIPGASWLVLHVCGKLDCTLDKGQVWVDKSDVWDVWHWEAVLEHRLVDLLLHQEAHQREEQLQPRLIYLSHIRRQHLHPAYMGPPSRYAECFSNNSFAMHAVTVDQIPATSKKALSLRDCQT